jgi:hypothetical protein
VERTIAWLNRMKRLVIRYERRADIHEAFRTPGCALICFRVLQGLCHSRPCGDMFVRPSPVTLTRR